MSARVTGGRPGTAVASPRPGRIVHKAEFERLLATRPKVRSAHFAVHHVALADPAAEPGPASAPRSKLSTDPAPACPQPVDDLGALRLGCLVPKRHARRAVTRNLVKRQAREAFARRAAALPGGLWLLRLVAPFPRGGEGGFVSAASPALARAVRAELDGLLARVPG